MESLPNAESATKIVTGNPLKMGDPNVSFLGVLLFSIFFRDVNSTLLHGKYELDRLLDHGAFAKVYHARNL